MSDIVHAEDRDVPANAALVVLLSEVERLRAEIERLRAENKELLACVCSVSRISGGYLSDLGKPEGGE